MWGAERTFHCRGSSEKLTEHENIRHGVGMGLSSVRPPILAMLREGVIITLRKVGFVDNNPML